jgi:hypothetical protein
MSKCKCDSCREYLEFLYAFDSEGKTHVFMRENLIALIKDCLRKHIDDMEIIGMTDEQIFGVVRFEFRNEIYRLLHYINSNVNENDEEAIKYCEKFYYDIRNIIENRDF